MGIKNESFNFLRDWVKSRSGIQLDGKAVMVESRLLTLADELKTGGIEELVSALRTDQNSPISARVLETLTTNETFWFRDHYPFEILRTSIIPEIVESRKNTRCFRFWSAACSMGQEPYSIAMILNHYFPQMDSWKVQILATDISAQMVEKAITGRYDQQELNRGLPAAFLARFFEPSEGRWQVKEEIRSKVQFRTMNLTQDFSIPRDLDVIFLRNVLIYFDSPTKIAILKKAVQHLCPGGYLFLGSAESLYGLDLPVENVMGEKTQYYRKRK